MASAAPFVQNNSGYKRESRPPRTPTQKEVFTGGKVDYTELTVFFNIAYFRLAGVIHHLMGKPYEFEIDDKGVTKIIGKRAIEKVYNEESITEWQTDKKVLAGLNDYLFKGFKKAKNSSGYEMDEKDEKLVIFMVKKFKSIRNFHSHYYHDNTVLVFPKNEKETIIKLHNEAISALMATQPKEVEKYVESISKNPFFKEHDREFYMTREGKIFLLSFFLTRSEMARLLQQCKGFKRNDTAEFKIKQSVYRHFTHRDGAARQHYGQEENMLNSLEPNDKKDILNARQAFKIISYLNDVPPEANDTELFPLFLENKPVVLVEEFRTFCNAHSIFSEITIVPLVKTVKDAENDKLTKDITLDNWLVVKMNDYDIQITKTTFHKLILDSLRRNDSGKLVEAQLLKFVDERNYLYELVKTFKPKGALSENNKLTLTDELDEYYRFKLRSDFLQKTMGKWLEGKEESPKQPVPRNYRYITESEKFVNRIKLEPIEVNYYDFYFEADEKPRAADLFMKYAVQYLIDFEKVRDWYFMVEHFEFVEETKTVMEYGVPVVNKFMVNKRIISYANTIEESKRLSLTPDNQIVVGFYTDTENKTVPPKNKFLLGARALKNLLIALHQSNDINPFFEDIVTDLNQIRKGVQPDELTTLKNYDIPASYKYAINNESIDIEAQKAKAQKRIETLVTELRTLLGNTAPKMSRADKNRQIMRCYKYFDWKYANSEFKFLRQDEYQQVSVYHYSLEKRRGKDLERGDLSFLLKGAIDHMPEVVKELLRASSHIDKLLESTIEKTINKLKAWQKDLPKAKGKDLKIIFSKLGISMNATTTFNEWLPFDIHPTLPNRIFFKTESATPNFSLSAKIWNDESLKKGLRHYYDYTNYLDNASLGDAAKKIRKYIIGSTNELLVRDALMWKMAKEYLNETSPAYKTYLGDTEQDWKVNYLRQTTIEKKLENNILCIKFHQLDDFLFVTSTDIIRRVCQQAIKRFENTANDNMEIERTDDGNGYKIQYSEVFKEVERTYNESLHWAYHVLAFEKKIIDSKTGIEMDTMVDKQMDAEIKRPLKKFKEEIPAPSQNQIVDFIVQWKAKALKFINFESVADNASITDVSLKKLLLQVRNKSFHAEIPDLKESNEAFSYWDLETDEKYRPLRTLLNYTPKIKIDYSVGLKKTP